MTDEYDNPSNTTIVPSTPSWMTDQRQKRQNRRGYGRRFSGVGSSIGGAGGSGGSSTGGVPRSTVTKTRRRESALFGTVSRNGGSTLSFDEDGEGELKNATDGNAGEEDHLLDRSAHARLQGRSRRPPRPKLFERADSLDQSAHARLESGMPRKKRPNLPRPPRATRATSKASSATSSQKNSSPNAEMTPFGFDAETVGNGSSSSSAADESQDKITSLLKGAPTKAGGDSKRSKTFAYRRSSNATVAVAAAKSASLFVENVHPNDTSGTAINNNNLSCSTGGTRRSSRIKKAKRDNSIVGLSTSTSHDSNDDDNNETAKPAITTRARARANCKKRSATSATIAGLGTPSEEDSDEMPRPSPTKIAAISASITSFSSASFSSSNSSIRDTNGSSSSIGIRDSNGSGGSESFSSLARKSSGQNNWANGKGTATKKGNHHKRSVTVSSYPNTNNGNVSANSSALETPSASLHHRSISCGGDLSSSVGNMSFFSPEDQGTTTPSVGSTSSRKRRTMDNNEIEEFDFLGCPERTFRSRRGPPSMMTPLAMDQHAINKLTPTVLKSVASEPVSMLSPPLRSSLKSSFKSLNGDMGLLNSFDDADEKKEEVRDRLSSGDLDESMMSTETDDDDDDSSTGSSSSEEDEDTEDETLREMTDAETFESKSSYDDFKFLAKSLQKCLSYHGKGASMGLNNGCVIAVPQAWTFEHRANFAKWVVTAFSFRVGSVGGAGCGSFLRSSDAKGTETLVKLRRILNDHKGGRLAPSKGDSHAINKKSRNEQCQGQFKTKAKILSKLSSKRITSSSVEKGLTLSLCDDFVGDLLADEMKGVTLDEMKVVKSPAVPSFIRSITPKLKLKPLASRIKNTTLPCFRTNSPTVEDGRRSRGGSGGCLPRLSSESAMGGSDFINQIHGMGGRPSGGAGRPPRLSSESAMGRSDFINQLHGVGSPSPMPNRRPPALRRALKPARRLSIESLRTSFDLPSNTGGLKPFESPHPRNAMALETPSSRLEIGLETPMPKQIENWGSRPILGKDWGESTCCCGETIDAASQIFAKSWFTSDFYDNAELSSEYRMALDKGDETHLFEFYDANADDDNSVGADSEIGSINSGIFDEFPIEMASKKIGFARCDSVGASAMDLLRLDDSVIDLGQSPSYDRRRTMKLRKYARMSLCVAAASDFRQPKSKGCYQLSDSPTTKRSLLQGTPINSIVDDASFSHVLSFLNEGELIHSACLVCTSWADASAEALGNLMLVSVGCDPLSHNNADDDSLSEADEFDSVCAHAVPPVNSSVKKSMERDWPYLMDRFPWAKFLSDGAFKRVYKVWNNQCRAYEALSVMDVDAIEDLGNSNLVGTELAVSVLLSSLARRNICPNFVVTRGVFTCQHEPPASVWGCRDDRAPLGNLYDGDTRSCQSHQPRSDQFGNYQYIRMELCEHGDVEEFIKDHPSKMLASYDCRNLLFQMAFALHVAANKFGLKHYDVKLLNFLLQSAKDPKIDDEEHPHVVLRYGIGSHVFRLRMPPSASYIAKLADYGTSVLRTDSDCQPVSLGQFTTLENTPPDFLILGNAAEQGYGHDSFGLGLCMLHLFTGHGPYEEILDEVFCPENLKGKLRKIWKSKSHDVIKSVMIDNDENGNEIEDETLYHTLYRFLVLFGVPEKQFGIRKHGKVWRAISSTLLPPKASRTNKCSDTDDFSRDRKKFSLADGTDKRISNARYRLQEMDGAMELLLSLVCFDPKTRATPLDVINSRFMANLIEDDNGFYCEEDIVKSFTAYLAN